jgi:hypothetical protein
MDPGTLITLLVAVLGSGAVTAVANNFWSRKRNKADTAAVLNETALELVAPLREEIRELRGEVTAYRHRIGGMERQQREAQAILNDHAVWDGAVMAALAESGAKFDKPMPPLHPDYGTREERTRAEDIGLADTRTPRGERRRFVGPLDEPQD